MFFFVGAILVFVIYMVFSAISSMAGSNLKQQSSMAELSKEDYELEAAKITAINKIERTVNPRYWFGG